MGGAFGKLLSGLFWRKEVKIFMCGLDAVGKTTILYTLKLSEIVTTIPTIGFNVETVKHQNLNLTIWEVGGGDKVRGLWIHYIRNVNAIIFVVDSMDRDRLGEAKVAINDFIVNDERVTPTALLVLANKQDLPNAMTADEITEGLGLKVQSRWKWHVEPTSATTGEGLRKGLDWLAAQLDDGSQRWF